MTSTNDLPRPHANTPDIKLRGILNSFDSQLRAYVQKNLPKQIQSTVGIEDVMQDVYLDAFRRIEEFVVNGEAATYRWLITIARHVMSNHLRSRMTKKRRADNGGVDLQVIRLLAEYIVYSRTPSRSAMSHELAQEIHRCLSHLTEDYRKAIELRFIQGLSFEETASQMNRSYHAAAMLCRRATIALREELSSIAPSLMS